MKAVNGWQTIKLAQCCEIISGATPRRNIPEYWNGDVAWVTPKDLSKLNDKILEDTPEKITQEGLSGCSARLLPQGALLFSSRAPIGHIAISGRPMATNQGFKSLIPSDDVDVNYLYWCLKYITPSIVAKGRGATFKEVSKGIMEEVEIPLPPLEEQRRIAAILDKADAIRKKRKKSIELTEAFLRSVCLDMFGDPITNPKGWELQPLGNTVENRDSMRVPVKQSDRDSRHGEYPYFGSVGIIDYIDDYIYEGMHLLISEDGKHLESRTRPITCIASGKFWVNNHAHVMRFNGKVDLVFLAHFLEMLPIHKYITGIDQIKLNRKSLDRIPVPVPPVDLQNKFTAIVEKARKVMNKFEITGEADDYLLNALSQYAFQGEL